MHFRQKINAVAAKAALLSGEISLLAGIQTWNNGSGNLRWGVSGRSGLDFILVGTTNLTAPITWEPISTNVAAVTPFSFIIPTTNAGAKFFGVRLGP